MFNYQKTVNEIFDLQQYAIKLGLDNIQALMKELGNPHQAYPVIHIAGTNGKGSTSFFIAKILENTGLKVGLYTSPHLADFRERIQVNGAQISEEGVIDFWQQIKTAVLARKATFFDTTTAMAFNYFHNQQVDVAVIETGLGGRLDSTNIVNPKIAVITPIHFDHEKQLGGTLEQIAGEKAGIIKKGTTVISAEQNYEALNVLKKKSTIAESFIYLPGVLNVELLSDSLEGMIFSLKDDYNQQIFKTLHCRQLGDFQLNNIAAAYFTSRMYMENTGITFKTDQFEKAVTENQWAGRLQLIRKKPNIIFDVSHNFIGIQKTLHYLSGLINSESLHILIGLVQDKDYLSIAEVISQYAREIIITEPDTHRKLDGQLLVSALKKSKSRIKLIKDLNEAYESCIKQLHGKDTLLVIGSHYLIGALLKNQNNLTY
ncbi:MAG: bifunctional folylpolyglutamate synthase/dihydrofolate synthase [Calditrichaceae bacterium]|nr:bifunctional folylpolyglutamate synthase/dihydrofolate synthase [Calditrichaceae bacterium]